ncbi:nuclear transport factor 2 family protein [Mycetohabitans rhizoxinica]|uniref:Nuclear transport factor 2 family protein n=1 Tax=Mycetohabitans rhizoxinica TaxID=412963 RepID=A0ABZ2PZ47_9BURK|nr:DUF4440 domain-containing protein [Mycetohabitans sp. B2]
MAKVIETIRGLERKRFQQQVIDSIVGGRRRYRQIEVQSQEIVPLSHDICMVNGRVLIEMEANSGALVYPIAYTAVQANDNGHWRLVVWHATRCAVE